MRMTFMRWLWCGVGDGLERRIVSGSRWDGRKVNTMLFKWEIAPKARSASASDPGIHWVFHLLHNSPELARLYHNVLFQPIPGTSVEYLLAGFASATFPMLPRLILVSVSGYGQYRRRFGKLIVG